jgi:kynureninase
MAPLYGSLQLFKEAGINELRKKSLHSTSYLMGLIDQELGQFGFQIANPKEDSHRGGHVSLEHEEAARICKALKKNGVIPDFRSPNVIRLAPMAFYTSYVEIWESVQILKKIMVEKQYEEFKNEREVIA